MKIVALLLILCISPASYGWGKRGHEIISSVAARLLAEENHHLSFLREHEFDLGYYANVPDLIWKNLDEKKSQTEHSLHFIDWNEDFIKVFERPQNLPVEFAEFKRKMGSHFDPRKGMAPWRIHEMFDRCRRLAEKINFDTQGPLLVCAGILSHYIGDLAQPLHVTDDYDGKKSGQEGVHAFFETTLVNAMDPELKLEILKRARQLSEKNQATRSVDERIRDLIDESHSRIPELLKLDKKGNRHDLHASVERFRPLIVERLSQGALTTAVIWREFFSKVKDFEEKKFYFFDGCPAYIEPSFLKGVL